MISRLISNLDNDFILDSAKTQEKHHGSAEFSTEENEGEEMNEFWVQ